MHVSYTYKLYVGKFAHTKYVYVSYTHKFGMYKFVHIQTLPIIAQSAHVCKSSGTVPYKIGKAVVNMLMLMGKKIR